MESPAASAVVKVGDCTGYAMTSQLILTAAHCVVPGDGGPPSIAKNTPVIVGANVGAGVQFLALDGGAYAFETVRDEEWMAAGAGAHLCP